jgi:hypothetical protein
MPTVARSSFHPLFFKRWIAVLLGGLVALMAAATHAETRVEGQVDSIHLEAHDATIQDTLSALSAAYHLRFRSSVPLNGSITGSFAGPLPSVIARVLASYDYVTKSEGGIIEVIVLGRQNPTPQPAARWETLGSAPQPVQRAAPAPTSSPSAQLPAGTFTDWEARALVARPAR